MLRFFYVISLLLLFAGSLSGCRKYPDVPKKYCKEVVKHSRKLLEDQADPFPKMLAECRKASHQARGCALAAKSAADLLRCSM